MRKLPRLFDAHTKQTKLRQIFDWLKDYTEKMKQLRSLQARVAQREDKNLRLTYWFKLRSMFEKSTKLNEIEKSLHKVQKRKYLTLWVSALNSRRNPTFLT